MNVRAASQAISTSPGMNVMIPMGGLGSRFTNEGYRLPKPLINIVGRPMLFWLLDNLNFGAEDTLWLGVPRKLGTNFALKTRLRNEYPSLHLRLIYVDFQTRGAVETLFIILQHMTPMELGRKSISLDCDTIYFSDVLGEFRACETGYGCSFYFEDEGNKPMYSYIRFKPGTKNITGIREKVAISRHANTGAYAFSCGETLRNACGAVLDNPVGKAGEFYLSAAIDHIVQTGEKLSSFLELVKTGEVKLRRAARFCFDLDHTLLTSDTAFTSSLTASSTERSGVLPLGSNVKLLQELRAAGHYVIVETCREKIEPAASSQDYALSGPGDLTLTYLRELGITFDEIVFGKPVADIYINGRAESFPGDTSKEIGWHMESSRDDDGGEWARDNFVAARSFNKITQLDDKHIVKFAPSEYLRGELHFYRSIPSALSHYFPRLVEGRDDASLEIPYITITKIDGVSFSHLVTHHCVTRHRFLKLLHGLRTIHNTQKSSRPSTKNAVGASAPVQEKGLAETASATIRRSLSPERSPEDLPASTLCANLYPKVSSRLKLNTMSYEGFEGVDVAAMAEVILSYLFKYQEERRYHQAEFIHGDPVFSNCLLTKDSSVVFIDMRGSLGDLLCTKGDVNYDLSKVYQSLCGYDFHILDKEVGQKAVDILEDLKQNIFWPFVREHYPGTSPRDIAVLAASHLLSIVPLHKDRRHRALFLAACEDILATTGLLSQGASAEGNNDVR